jgi:TM2 domain-containing membrane protein YozV
MTNRSASAAEPPPNSESYSVLAGFLSYLVPGLGQILQGRVGKGLLFFVCVYGLFWYGMLLSTGKAIADGGQREFRVSGNVYLPDVSADESKDGSDEETREGSRARSKSWDPRRLASNLYNRPQFAGQFWVGIAAWPAVYQYLFYGNVPDPNQNPSPPTNRLIGNFERTPPEWALIQLIQQQDKTWDLAWVFTVVAGVLNVLVIYDAAAGPLFQVKPQAAGSPGRTVPT